MSDINKFHELLTNFLDNPQVSEEILLLSKNVDGMCSPEVLALLNLAVSQCLNKDELYLEIGTWMGRTAIAALTNNDKEAIVIDPLICDNSSVKCLQNFVKYNVQKRICMYVDTWQNVIRFCPSNKVGIHFFDGDHGDNSSFSALEEWIPNYSDEAILIVDDYCMDPVKRDIENFRTKYSANIVFEYKTNFSNHQYIIGFKK